MTRVHPSPLTSRFVAAHDHLGHADIPPPSDADWLPSPSVAAVEPAVQQDDAETRSEVWCG
ncbi:MAG: hypothetical protein Q7V88_05750 [Actinomycetota bacterium]|nr:hypothetical protein [Actinomycetota bacterium]